MHSRTASTSARVKDASQISLGSPVANLANKKRLHAKSDLRLDTDEKDLLAQVDQSPLIGTKGSPASLSMPFTCQEANSAKSERGFSGTFASAAASTSAIGSRPDTPLTTASRISESSAARQPRILRVVETPKPITPTPVATAPSVAASTTTADKSRSRRHSLSSNSRPDTPGDYGSEADFFPSTSVSRANSPPASSRIGSAPVRSITKSQAKKERRQKAKEAEAKKVEVVAVPQESVQAPIMGRKRKTKKAASTPTDPSDGPSLSVAETASPVKAPVEPPKKVEPKPEPPKKVKEKEQPTPDIKPARVEEPPIPPKAHVEEAWRSHNTVQQATKDAEESGRSFKDLLMERTKPLHEILAQMHKSGSLDLNKSSLFNPVSLGQRTDMKCTADDYDHFKQPLELTDEHRKALRRGEPVRIGNDQLKNRCLITPRGSVLRHLDPEEEARYLQLENQRNGFTDPFVVGDDSSNINGGLEALFATPEKYNIRWVDEPARLGATSPTSALTAALAADNIVPPNVLSAMEADSTRNHDWAIAHSAELLQTTTDAVRSFAAATAKQILGTAGIPCANPSLEEVSTMTNEELKELSGRSQKDLESTRKELDSLDKKFAALLRRNKKVQQQALSMIDSPN
jgi:CCR4-NOT transcription complex subunit 4